jgi:hypothetical protein
VNKVVCGIFANGFWECGATFFSIFCRKRCKEAC